MLNNDLYPFLKELKQNNNRDWFKARKEKFDELRFSVQDFAGDIFGALVDDNNLGGHKVFRIYKDVRFSKDKTPYKTHFGIGFHRIKPQFRGGYYLHLEPGNSFLATGFGQPNKEDLFRLRKEIEFDHNVFSKMVTQSNLIKLWGNLKGEQLKTCPKGFDKEHEAIKYLRYKQFLFHKEISDDAPFKSDFKDFMIAQFNAVRPFLDYAGDVLTTDLNGESLL